MVIVALVQRFVKPAGSFVPRNGPWKTGPLAVAASLMVRSTVVGLFCRLTQPLTCGPNQILIGWPIWLITTTVFAVVRGKASVACGCCGLFVVVAFGRLLRFTALPLKQIVTFSLLRVRIAER